MNNDYKKEFFDESIAENKQSTFLKTFFDALKNGDVKRTQSLQVEYQRFEEEWLNNLNTFFPSLIQITRDLKSSLRTEEEILPVEKTRRTNPESIRHLLRNTRYIKDIDESGDIIPEKVLNALSEIDYGIYENRFIMTLVDRLYHYLYRRIEVIREHVMGNKEMHFNYESFFEIDKTSYQMQINIKANEEIDIKEIDIHNYRIYEMANEAFKVISRIYHSDFMQVMKKYQKVKPPIMKTQIILKNPNFKNAYLLWLYLDKLNELEYTLERKIKKVDFSKTYSEEIDRSISALFSTIYNNSDISIKDGEIITENIKPKSNDVDYVNNASLTPVPYVLEPNLATEYHLKKAKQFINKQFTEITQTTHDHEQSLKQLLVDQYGIANQVFNYYFETDQDEDVFDRLINYANPVRRYEEALRKYVVAKTQREVTEKMFNDAVNLEARWIREADILHKEAIKHIMDKEYKETEEVVMKMRREHAREMDGFDRELVSETKKKLRIARTKNKESIQLIKKSYSDKLKEFRVKERERVANEREKIKERNKIMRQKIKEKRAKEREKELLKLKKKREQDKEALRKRLMMQKDNLRKQNNEKLRKLASKAVE